MREQLADVERELREVGGTKIDARLLADLRESANDLEAEVYRTLSEVNVEVKEVRADPLWHFILLVCAAVSAPSRA
jgi:hypothetical protein